LFVEAYSSSVIVYFVRHGIAQDAQTWGGADAERPLTGKGRAKMAAIGRRLCELDIKPDVILTSPLVRAHQTAEIVAKALRLSERVEREDRLAGGFDPGALGKILHDRAAAQTLMLVGHEPGLSAVIGHAAGNARVELKKGAVACLEFPNPKSPRGELLWLAPPKILTG
jgi:phosphohistidine phosphatase